MRDAPRRIKEKVTVAVAGRAATAGDMTYRLDAPQVMAVFTVHFDPTPIKDFVLYERCSRTPIDTWFSL